MSSDRPVSLVTGAATGIGRATARRLVEDGFFVYFVDIDEGGGLEAVGDSTAAAFLRCDVTSESDVASMISRIEVDRDRVDVLVNNAGGFPQRRTMDDVTLAEWKDTIDLNLTSVFLVSRAMLGLIRNSTRGRIVNIGSLSGQVVGWSTSPAYAAAKAAVHALTRVMAQELAPTGTTVNTIAPSAVLTDRIRELRDEEELATTAATVPLGRYQTPDEVAGWVAFLASEESAFMTGQTISVNGGRFMA
ncbi:MAG TPA: SDR family NAD(P)-dependent oxidoreductase [Acidimicrobiia bacterium]|nr:SDR family NAD(P)-dependent oxidoreductase [Acidimicrobiia bacterium]